MNRLFTRAGFAKAVLVTAALAVPMTAQTVTTVLNNGTTDTRYDMVILGDGYQVQEQTQFNTDVTTFLASLFQTQPRPPLNPFLSTGLPL